MTRSTLRALLVGAAAVLLGCLGLWAPSPAHAAGDTITDWTATYTVAKDGTTTVVEKTTYVFGRFDAHGMERVLVVREPWQGGKDQDRTYDVKVVDVTATGGVSTQVSQERVTTTGGGAKGANQALRIRVGSANETVPANKPITYTLTYTVADALIDQGHGPELYWDVIPSDFRLPISSATVTMEWPSGTSLVKTTCNAGATGSSGGGCSEQVSGSSVTWTASNLGQGTGMTTSTIAPAGTVDRTGPTLVTSAKQKERANLTWAGVSLGAGSVLAAVLGWLWTRTKGRDERYVGLPPGIVPAANEQAEVGRDHKPEIPVAFSPPRITPGEAGLLLDGQVDVRDTTATLVDLAVRGVIGISADKANDSMFVQLRDVSRPVHDYERVLLDKIFGGAGPGTQVDLAERGAMLEAHRAETSVLRENVKQAGWFKALPPALGGSFSGGGGGIIVVVIMFFVFGAPATLGSMLSGLGGVFVGLVPFLALLGYVLLRMRRGRRTALGRALADQTEGFRKYLATAEAEQLRFEEGEDIFSKYLPWAIMFQLTDRWTKVCQDLVAMGRIPDAPPAWYYGSWYGFGHFDAGWMGRTLDTASTPVPSSDSGSGSGFSSFGGGSVGGGGGGGGGGSW